MDKWEEIEMARTKIGELRKRIRDLRVDGIVDTGKARIAPKQSYTCDDEQWQVAYAVPLQGRMGTHYKALCTGTRQECISAIPGIIANLKELYDEAMKEKKIS